MIIAINSTNTGKLLPQILNTAQSVRQQGYSQLCGYPYFFSSCEVFAPKNELFFFLRYLCIFSLHCYLEAIAGKLREDYSTGIAETVSGLGLHHYSHQGPQVLSAELLPSPQCPACSPAEAAPSQRLQGLCSQWGFCTQAASQLHSYTFFRLTCPGVTASLSALSLR